MRKNKVKARVWCGKLSSFFLFGKEKRNKVEKKRLLLTMDALLNVVYRSPTLLWLFKLVKMVVRLATGTSELYRLCSPPQPQQQPRTINVNHPLSNSEPTSSSSSSAVTSVEYHELVDTCATPASSSSSSSSHVSPLTIYRIGKPNLSIFGLTCIYDSDISMFFLSLLDRAIFYSKHLHVGWKSSSHNIQIPFN